MPKDEDILQLVSPSVCMEGLGSARSSGPLWEKRGGNCLLLLNWGSQAHPWAGAACCHTPGCSVLGRQELLLALVGRIPARVSERVAQRALPAWHVLVCSCERCLLPAPPTHLA